MILRYPYAYEVYNEAICSMIVGLKGQGHRVIECKNILKVIGWPAGVSYVLYECPTSSFRVIA